MRQFTVPFALSGDRAPIPDAAQPSGAVSFTQGYGPDYSRDPETDPEAKRIERLAFNSLMFDITEVLKDLQDNGVTRFLSGKEGGYSLGALVRDQGSGGVFVSLASANTADVLDSSKWLPVALTGATNTTPGFIRVATAAEVTAGTLDNVAITPARLAAYLSGGVVPTSRTITAGNGLTGGGTLAANRTISMGTPSTITGSSTNVANSDGSHSHAINLGVANVSGAAPLNSPALTGTPTAPTPLTADSSTKVATTAFVQAVLAGVGGSFGALAYLNSVNNSNWSGAALAVANGGTGGTSQASARTGLGLGSWATRGDGDAGRVLSLALGSGSALLSASGSSPVLGDGERSWQFQSSGAFAAPGALVSGSGVLTLGARSLSYSGGTFTFSDNSNVSLGNGRLSAGPIEASGSVALRGPADGFKVLMVYASGALRWQTVVTPDSDGGAWAVQCHDDAGAFRGVALRANRETGDVRLDMGDLQLSLADKRVEIAGARQPKFTTSTAAPSDYAGVQVGDWWGVYDA